MWFFLANLTASLLCFAAVANAEEMGTASWYSRASIAREGLTGIMANGARLDDHQLTAASWSYPLGSVVQVCRVDSHGQLFQKSRCVKCVLTDRGPARRLVRRGRIIDLTPAAFMQLAPLEEGVVQVRVEQVEGP